MWAPSISREFHTILALLILISLVIPETRNNFLYSANKYMNFIIWLNSNK